MIFKGNKIFASFVSRRANATRVCCVWRCHAAIAARLRHFTQYQTTITAELRRDPMSQSLVFVDARVADYQTLIDGLAPGSEVYVIDAESDGVAQIAARLQGRSGIDALHIISRGRCIWAMR